MGNTFKVNGSAYNISYTYHLFGLTCQSDYFTNTYSPRSTTFIVTVSCQLFQLKDSDLWPFSASSSIHDLVTHLSVIFSITINTSLNAGLWGNAATSWNRVRGPFICLLCSTLLVPSVECDVLVFIPWQMTMSRQELVLLTVNISDHDTVTS